MFNGKQWERTQAFWRPWAFDSTTPCPSRRGWTGWFWTSPLLPSVAPLGWWQPGPSPPARWGLSGNPGALEGRTQTCQMIVNSHWSCSIKYIIIIIIHSLLYYKWSHSTKNSWPHSPTAERKKDRHIQQCTTGCQKTAEERGRGRGRRGEVLSKKT